jgi:hypothetical protein
MSICAKMDIWAFISHIFTIDQFLLSTFTPSTRSSYTIHTVHFPINHDLERVVVYIELVNHL